MGSMTFAGKRVSTIAVFVRNNDRQFRLVTDGLSRVLHSSPHLTRYSVLRNSPARKSALFSICQPAIRVSRRAHMIWSGTRPAPQLVKNTARSEGPEQMAFTCRNSPVMRPREQVG